LTLRLFTQAIGRHYQNDFREDVNEFVSRDDEHDAFTSHRNGSLEAVTTGLSVKDFPHKGNHKDPVFYGRSGAQVLEDVPFVTRTTSYNPHGALMYSGVRTAYISRQIGSFDRDLSSELPKAECYGEADTKALNHLADQKAQIGSDIAQAGQTLRALADAAERAASVLLAFKRGRFGEAAKALGRTYSKGRFRGAANQWLEFSYGWKPLADDLYGLSELANGILSRPIYIRGTGRAEISTSRDRTSGLNRMFQETKTTARTVLVATVANDRNRLLNQTGLSNPLAIAWDLLPWSFAVDWFVPVGNTLEAMTASYGLNFKKGWRTHHDNSMTKINKVSDGWDDGTTLEEPGSFIEQYFSFFRDPFGDFPRASFYANVHPFSIPRAVNAIALIRQLHR